MNTDYNLTFLGYNDDDNRTYTCPFCGDTIVVQKDVFYGRCPSCLATIIDYKPLPYQMDFHKDNALYRLVIGAYGTGKTTECCAEIASHVLEVANGKTLITAQTLQQVSEAVIPELEKFLPPWFIERQTKSPMYYKMSNGHEIVIYASDDEQKFRSLNLTAFYIEEASGVDYSVFTQLQTRLRNQAAIIKDKYGMEIGNKYMGLVSTNPDESWVMDKFLLISSQIKASASVDVSVYERLKIEKPQEYYHSFLSATKDNPYLHDNFIKSLCAGKTRAWIRKYIDCYLDVKEGAVYPDFSLSVIEPFKIPDHWQRVVGYDRGFSDQTAWLIGAINPEDGIVYIYKEYYVNQQPVSVHAKQFRQDLYKRPIYGNLWACPSVRETNDVTGVSYKDYFCKLTGYSLEPHIARIETGIEKVRDYMYLGKLKVFNNCTNLRMEASKYTYKDTKNDINVNDRIVDKFNHLMDCLRYMIASLPLNPNETLEAVYPSFRETREKSFWEEDIEEDLDSFDDSDYVGAIYGLGGVRL